MADLPHPVDRTDSKSVLHGVSLRATITGLASIIGLCFLTPYNDHYVGGTFLGGNHLPIASLMVLLFLALGVNIFLRIVHLRPFSCPELITVWVMVAMGIGIASSGLMRLLIPTMTQTFYYATPENKWQELVGPYLSNWICLHDPQAIKYFYERLPEGMTVPWGAWVKPLISWTIFTFLIYFAMICLSVMLRRQWVERERFTFPLVQLPAEMSYDPEPGHFLNRLFRNPMMWIGCVLAITLASLNGLAAYFPWVPHLNVPFAIGSREMGRPWDRIFPLSVRGIYTSVIGFTFLLPSDISLSFWFFFLFARFQLFMGDLLGFGMETGGGYGAQFLRDQEVGGYLALIVSALWLARPHLREVWRKAWHNDPAVDDSNEPLPYRWAFFGLIGATILMVAWAMLMGAGFLISLVAFLLTFVILIGVSWVVNAGGLLFVQTNFRPMSALTTALGSARIDPRSLTVLSSVGNIWSVDLREVRMPTMLNCLKISDEGRLRRRQLLGAMALAIVVAIGFSYYANISLAYRYGGAQMQDGWMFRSVPQLVPNEVSAAIENPKPPNWGGLAGITWGGIFVWLLLWMRLNFTWWPLHPIGLLTAMTYPMAHFWFPFMVGWLLKVIVVHYGGLKGYTVARPFFLGLILGDCFAAGAWIVVGMITKVHYMILPG